MELNFSNISIKLPDSLDEITFGDWLLYSKEVEGFDKLEPDSIEAQIKLFRLCEILAGLPEGGLDDLMIGEATLVIQAITDIVNKKVDFKANEAFQIEGKWYATRKLEDMNSLTNGEYISLKTIQAEYEKDPYLFLPLVVSILVRPAEEVIDAETGSKKWVVEKFQSRDIDNLYWRASLFKEKALARDLVPVINFFLTGKVESIKNTETYSGQEQKQTPEEIPSQQQ